MRKLKRKHTIAIIIVAAITAYFVMRTPTPFSDYESERYYLLYSYNEGSWKTFGRKRNKGYSEEKSCLYELFDVKYQGGSFSCAKGDEMVITEVVITDYGHSYNRIDFPDARIGWSQV